MFNDKTVLSRVKNTIVVIFINFQKILYFPNFGKNFPNFSRISQNFFKILWNIQGFSKIFVCIFCNRKFSEKQKIFFRLFLKFSRNFCKTTGFLTLLLSALAAGGTQKISQIFQENSNQIFDIISTSDKAKDILTQDWIFNQFLVQCVSKCFCHYFQMKCPPTHLILCTVSRAQVGLLNQFKSNVRNKQRLFTRFYQKTKKKNLSRKLKNLKKNIQNTLMKLFKI